MRYPTWRQSCAAVLIAAACATSHAYCFNEAAQRYGVEADLLRAIAAQESEGRPDTSVVNSNGSVDRGLMGINSVHLSDLSRFGITARALYDPCTNVMAGAWLLKKKILKYGYTWAAVGAYHSETPNRGVNYQLLIYRRWRGIAKRPQSAQVQVPPAASSSD
ncbi:lytic transglycosylase domain-containing protein [Variovorax gossypii]